LRAPAATKNPRSLSCGVRAGRLDSVGWEPDAVLVSPSSDSPLRTGHATFTASGSPTVGATQFVRWSSSAFHRHSSRIPPCCSVQVQVSPAIPRGKASVSGPASDSRLPLLREGPTICRPSPCGRLSRPPTTMAAPTLDAGIRGLLTLSSCIKSLTFMKKHSTESFRRRFSRPTYTTLCGPRVSAG